MVKRSLLSLFMFVLASLSTAQECQVSGVVTALESGAPIPFAKVIVEGEKKSGTITDEQGAFSLNYACSDSLKLMVRHPDFEPRTRFYSGPVDAKILIQLTTSKAIKELEEVVVRGEGKDANVSGVQVGKVQLKMKDAKKLPAFMGEVDIIKTLQLTPGVSSAAEGTQGFYVRGGPPDQNLVLLDGTHVYNASHLFGFFSVFNVDAIEGVELIKAGIPARYGGRLSSVLKVNSYEGNKEKWGVRGGVGLLSSRLTVEGPLQKNKGAIQLSGRRTYIDLITQPFIPDDGNFNGTGYYFYDLNAKIDYKLSDKDKLFISGYYGKDDFTFATNSGDFNVDMPWGNAIGTVKWNHVFNDEWLLTSSVGLTDYQFAFQSGQDDFRVGISSGIRDYSGEVNLRFKPNPRHEFNAGLNYVYHIFTPISASADQGETDFDLGEAQELLSHESALYLSDDFNVTENWKLYAGIRYSTFQHVGPFERNVPQNAGNLDSTINYDKGALIANYGYWEPRISTRFLIDENNSVKAGWNRNAQYVHLANLSAVALPTDIWFPSTDLLKPQIGWQGSIGYFRNFQDHTYESSVEIYYKSMDNLVAFREGVLPQDNAQENTDQLLTQGEGYSVGVEFFLKKNWGDFTGWIGYTLSKTERRFEAINNNAYFPAKYDRRHDLSVVASYTFNENWSMGTAFVFATGNTITLPTSWYLHDGDVQFEFQERNASRLPAYHRLDLSVTWNDRPTKKVWNDQENDYEVIQKKWRHSINFSIYNVYSRQNPFFLYVQNQGNLMENNFNLNVQQVSLFPILPSITWNFEM